MFVFFFGANMPCHPTFYLVISLKHAEPLVVCMMGGEFKGAVLNNMIEDGQAAREVAYNRGHDEIVWLLRWLVRRLVNSMVLCILCFCVFMSHVMHAISLCSLRGGMQESTSQEALYCLHNKTETIPCREVLSY